MNKKKRKKEKKKKKRNDVNISFKIEISHFKI